MCKNGWLVEEWRMYNSKSAVVIICDQQWGVLKAVSNVNDILAPKLVGLDVTDQAKIDKMMVEENLELQKLWEFLLPSQLTKLRINWWIKRGAENGDKWPSNHKWSNYHMFK